MLKYCEAYRTMRESLCREQSREQFNRDATDQRQSVETVHRRLSLATKECDEAFEKQNRRQSASFDKEFTFSPRLNTTSVRIAKERNGRAHEAIERRTTALAAETEQNFTFKPKVSSKSEKIAQSLKTSFLERQLIHVEKQRQKFDNADTFQFSQNCSRLSPVVRLSRPHKELELTKSERLQTRDRIPNRIEKTSRSMPDCIMATKQHETQRRHLEQTDGEVDDFPNSSPHSVVENLTFKRSRQNLVKHKRLKTYPGAISQRVGDDTKENEHHQRSSSIPSQYARSQYDNMLLYNRLRQSKLTAENAMKEGKIFVCHGPYPIVRASLRKRGWIEKHFKGCAAAVAHGKKKSQSTNIQEKQNNEDGKEESKGSKKQELMSDGDDSFDCDEHRKWQAGYEGEDCEYSLLSRFCRNATASFFWTCRRDDIDFKYLRKDQMANHFSRAYSFTTKVGLCSNLRNLTWFEDAHSNTFFPRCHRLGYDGEKEDFIDDYRLTSACNILKLVAKQPPDKKITSFSRPTSAKVAKPQSMFSGKSTSHSNESSSLDDATQPRSRSSITVRKDVIGEGKSRAVMLALRACDEFVMRRKNEDIDQCHDKNMTDKNWEELIGYYYQMIHNKVKVEASEDLKEQCWETLQELRHYLPQLDLDGVRNVWIVKPGAKSRGRGIMCMDRLEDILNLVSSTVKKENRWIVQKYIECPLLVYNTKFDIRQWFLVTDWNPLTLWFYKDCYLRFCSQEFTLDDFEPCIHLANNSIQKHYQNGIRDKRLPDNNMWSSEDFQNYLREKGKGYLWEKVIYPGMKEAIMYTLECCQITLEARKNSFELYGADFMLTGDYKPWLIEVNSSPAMSASTHITRKLCANVIEDTMKVVLDRREDKHCDTGRFELAFKQPYVDAPPYSGINLAVLGKGILTPPFIPFRRQWSATRSHNTLRPKDKTPKTQSDLKENEEIDEETQEDNIEKSDQEATILKLKETSLVLNCSENNEVPTVVSKATKQIRYTGKTYGSTVEVSRRWKSVNNTDKKQDDIKSSQPRTLNLHPNIKPAPKNRTIENKFAKTTNRPARGQKMNKTNQEAGNENTLSPRIIAIPDVGVRKTILRYTDKRFRPAKTTPIDMGTSFRLRKDAEFVK